MKIAIFQDFFRIIGGAEILTLKLAEGLKADIITSETDPNIVSATGFKNIKIISLGEISKFPCFVANIARKRFSEYDFSEKYDFFIFSGNFSIYAAKKHKPNLWYCHTPLKGLYDPEFKKYFRNVTLYSKIVDFKKKIMPERIIPKNVAFLLDNFFNSTHNLLNISKEITRNSKEILSLREFNITTKSDKMPLKI